MQNEHMKTTVPNSPDSTPYMDAGYTGKIKVTVHIPDNIHETIRRQKINRIYDILSPEISH